MGPLFHRRQLVLFLAAILVPYAVLIGLSIRLVTQDRELSRDRGASRRRQLADQASTQLLERLDSIRRDEILTALPAGGQYRHRATALVARVEDDRLTLPWDEDRAARDARASISQPGFQSRIRACEQAEFGSRGAARAAQCHQQAAAQASDRVQRDYAGLLRARSLDRAGAESESLAQFRALLDAPVGVTDEDGVPLRLYAAQRLLASSTDQHRIVERAGEAILDRPWLPPLAAFIASDIAERLGRDETSERLRREIGARVRLIEQAEALQADFPRLGLLRMHRSGQRAWICYGDDKWLVGVASGEAILAVRGADVFLPVERRLQVRFTDAQEIQGELLGLGFPGLKVIADASAGPADRSQFERWLFYAALCLVAAATLFGAYLLWRDLRRDLRLSEMRSQFVSSVSHELRTPLTAIRMLAETLQMGRCRDQQTQTEYLETIVNECQRLSRLVDGVLLFSKSEQGRKTYYFRPTEAAETVRAAARAMEYPLSQKGFRLHLNIQPDLPPVKADHDALEQAILNLLSNALKYSGDSRDIELGLDRHNGDVVIRVTDHGVGIAPEEQLRIFEKFYRAPTAENQLIPGAGLGLALVDHIVKAHGGRIVVDSAPGKGSTFSVCLRVEEGA